MYVLEVAAQNVRGFSPTVRAALKPGYNVLKPPAPPTVAPLGQLAQALCFSDGRGGDVSFLAPGAKAGKAGLIMMGKDSVTYRVLRELGGSGTLQRMNPTTGQFELVSEDAAEIGQFLRSQVGLPSKNALDQVYCVLASQMPSKRPKKAPGAALDAPAAPQRTISRELPISPADDLAQANKRLAELTAELKTAKETSAIQFEFDGVVSEVDNVERKIKMLEELKAQSAEAEAAWKASPTPQSLGLPADLQKRAERYEEFVAKRNAELAKLKDAKEEDLEPFWLPEQMKAKKVPPLWKDERFWYGIGAGIAALVLGVFLKGYAKYVALLDIPAFGFSAMLAYRWVEELQATDYDRRRGGRKAQREAKIKEEYEANALAVEKAIELLQVDNAKEVIAKLKEKDELLTKFNAVRAKVEAFEADPVYQEGVARLPEMKAEQERLNNELAARGGYMREPREIEKDIDRLKQSIALARSGPAAAAPAAVAETAPGSAGLEDPCPGVLKVAADLFQTDIGGAVAVIRDRTLQYFAAFTDKRYQMIDFDVDGNASAIAQGKATLLSQLPPKDADLLHLALKLTVVEKAAAKQKVPMFIEDGISCVDEPKLPLLARMLKHLGTLTQVIHVTAHPGFSGSADHNVTL